MHIKFLRHGRGCAKKAIKYLLGEIDHKGEIRAHVEVLRGDPQVFADVANSLTFAQRYTSGVIAWSGEDKPTREQMEQVLDAYERLILSGLKPSRHCWCAVLHQEQNGSWHIHTLHARVDLLTGLSYNIAPPRKQLCFDHLRDHFNLLNDWARPDDHARRRAVVPDHVGEALDIRDYLADPEHRKPTTAKAVITQFLITQIERGVINDRHDVELALAMFGKVTRQGLSKGEPYVGIQLHPPEQGIPSIEKQESTSGNKTSQTKAIRLYGAIFDVKFSRDTYLKSPSYGTRASAVGNNRTGEVGRDCDRPVCGLGDERFQLASEAKARLEQSIQRRSEFNRKYYRPRGRNPEADSPNSLAEPEFTNSDSDSSSNTSFEETGLVRVDYSRFGNGCEYFNCHSRVDFYPKNNDGRNDLHILEQSRAAISLSDEFQLDDLPVWQQANSLQKNLGVTSHEHRSSSSTPSSTTDGTDQSAFGWIARAYAIARAATVRVGALVRATVQRLDEARTAREENNTIRREAEKHRTATQAAFGARTDLPALAAIVGRVGQCLADQGAALDRFRTFDQYVAGANQSLDHRDRVTALTSSIGQRQIDFDVDTPKSKSSLPITSLEMDAEQQKDFKATLRNQF